MDAVYVNILASVAKNELEVARLVRLSRLGTGSKYKIKRRNTGARGCNFLTNFELF